MREELLKGPQVTTHVMCPNRSADGLGARHGVGQTGWTNTALPGVYQWVPRNFSPSSVLVSLDTHTPKPEVYAPPPVGTVLPVCTPRTQLAAHRGSAHARSRIEQERSRVTSGRRTSYRAVCDRLGVCVTSNEWRLWRRKVSLRVHLETTSLSPGP